ncbi:hypothetical protein BSK59_28785 [Paenibacillus odorifer]|nr:hypothetical protein BSK59_28785 [Paenibacillus odorifer]
MILDMVALQKGRAIHLPNVQNVVVALHEIQGKLEHELLLVFLTLCNRLKESLVVSLRMFEHAISL